MAWEENVDDVDDGGEKDVEENQYLKMKDLRNPFEECDVE